MKNLIGLAAIAATLSLFVWPAAAGGGHRGVSDVQTSLNRSTKPVTHFQARDLRDHGLDRGDGHRHFGQPRKRGHFQMRSDLRRQGHGQRHGRSNKRGHGHKRQNRAIIFNFGFAAPAVSYQRPRHFAQRPLPVYVIRDRLYRSRYSHLGPVYFEAGHYRLRARNPRGARVKLVIHASSGAIVRRTYVR